MIQDIRQLQIPTNKAHHRGVKFIHLLFLYLPWLWFNSGDLLYVYSPRFLRSRVLRIARGKIGAPYLLVGVAQVSDTNMTRCTQIQH